MSTNNIVDNERTIGKSSSPFCQIYCCCNDLILYFVNYYRKC